MLVEQAALLLFFSYVRFELTVRTMNMLAVGQSTSGRPFDSVDSQDFEGEMGPD